MLEACILFHGEALTVTPEELANQIRTLRDMNLMLAENAEEEVRQLLIDAINQSAAEGSVQALRGLRESFRMIAGVVVEHLTEEERALLDRRLREKCGKGLREESERDARLIAAVRRRGAIRHEREYRTIDAYVNELAQNGGEATRIAALESLLEQFVRRGDRINA